MIAEGYARRAHAASAASRRWKRGWPTRNCCSRTRTPNTPPSSRSTWPTSTSRSWPARTIRTTSRRCRDVAGAKIDEVFIGSCMTNIGHFRAAVEAAGRQARHPGQAVGRAADQDGPEAADRGRPLRRLRHGRRAHRNAGLLAVHGQPGAGARRRDGVLHLHPQLPEPPGQEHATCTSARPNWPRSARRLGASRPRTSTWPTWA